MVSDGFRILVLSFYYRPDLSAGSFRTGALIDAMLPLLPADSRIEVITTLPNRYSTFDSSAPETEESQGLSIRRIRLPAHRSGMVDQARAFGVFARAARRLTQGQRYDLVYATSSRLMTAALGARIARKLGAPLYLDIRDLFADTIKDVLPRRFAVPTRPLFQWLERRTMRTAARVNLVSRGFETYFRERYPQLPLSFFTNGIDEEFIAAAGLARASVASEARPLRVLYAGNIGEGQGLHAVVPGLAAGMADRARFTVIGDGGRRPQLEAAIARAGVSNVELRPPVPRDALIEAYRDADVLFLHLNDYEAFRKVLPSKIFEYAAMGKPILAGVAGHAAQFLRAEVPNAQVFPPCDAQAGVAALERLTPGYTPRDAFVARYSRSAIMSEMARDVLQYAQGGSNGPAG